MKPLNLCDTCRYDFAIYEGTPIFDESSETKDNVKDCNKYEAYDYWIWEKE